VEKSKVEMAERFRKELKKERDAWIASEKVRKEKWEMEKIEQIKQGTVMQLEPTIKQILEKNKDELAKQAERHQ
jgi:5-azacytidine-induced protein 1